jgi:hypothetical protein
MPALFAVFRDDQALTESLTLPFRPVVLAEHHADFQAPDAPFLPVGGSRPLRAYILAYLQERNNTVNTLGDFM